MLTEILLIGLMCLSYYYWSDTHKAHEAALAAATRHCVAMEVQLLDGYVALKATRLHRNANGKLQLQRTFEFEFSSTGEHRYFGSVVMLGQLVAGIEMQPYRIQ
ncbi:MAG: DUF3301 domain-containing protein [Methylococcaceae bacterium]|nr:DUF3301 domain-containing protein [Methylococcaceae bacterium]